MSDKPTFKAGDRVEAKLGNQWHPANVTGMMKSGAYIVEFDFSFSSYVRLPEEVQAPYATYDGGKSQYDADLATLDAAAQYGANSETPDGKFSYQIVVVLSRMLPYLRGKGVL